MRYRIGADGLPVEAGVHASGDVVVATVWATLFIGILFVVIGVRAHQRWLRFWGVLTCLCCAAYFLRGPLGLDALLV